MGKQTTSFGVREQGDFRLNFFDREDETEIIINLGNKQYIITLPFNTAVKKLDSIEKIDYLRFALIEYHYCSEKKLVFGRKMDNFYYKAKFSSRDNTIIFGDNILTIKDTRHSKVLQEYIKIWLDSKN